MEQGASVVDHNPRVFALLHQAGNELTHALVAPAENLCVVPVFIVGTFLHELEIANERCMAHEAPSPWTSGRDERLVHVQSNGAATPNITEINPALVQENRSVPAGANSSFNDSFRAAQIGKTNCNIQAYHS
ncbi:MAG: hypothetical protein ABSG91_25050 [Syntrophobacteraceae bacterium]|jgi:hypothetical protein